MLTYQDCIGLCDLTDEEVEAIAEHEHVPDIVAAELGSYLVHSDTGTPMIKRIIIDDIQHARDQGHPCGHSVAVGVEQVHQCP